MPEVESEPNCGQTWGLDCTARDWGHQCRLLKGHTIDHLCACKRQAACVCICHDSDRMVNTHVRPCCIDWVGGFTGEVANAYPLIEARVRRQVAEEIRDLAKDDDRYGLANFRAFIQRHKRLVHGESVPAVLLAVADEIKALPERTENA